MYSPWVHRIAVLTTLSALLPIVVGAMVTTLDAGMAFSDWPSSDGHSMWNYPWLRSAGDQFLEHGHRLAGALVGIVSIVLATVTWFGDKRRAVQLGGLLVLIGVILQGLLGGMRVLANRSELALVHGIFAAIVFSLMATMALVTSRRWHHSKETENDCQLSPQPVLRFLTVLTVGILFIQALLGGRIRHLGDSLHEHLGIAMLATGCVIMTAFFAIRSGHGWLKSTAVFMVLFVILQIALGMGAWVTKYGLPLTGYVAVEHSAIQVYVRSGHTVIGMMLFMSAILLTVKAQKLASIWPDAELARSEKSQIVDIEAVKGGVG